jgi:hypothetical protein
LRRSTLENIVGLQVLNLQDTAVIVLNATHTTGSCRLPSDLLDIYIRYKQGTTAIIAWLVQHSPPKYRSTISIQDLLDFCEVVQARAISMPDAIDFYFRETIAASVQLRKIFRMEDAPHVEDVETTNHEYFTTW